MTTSPFQPGFGSFPPALVGRDEILRRVGERLDEGSPEQYLVRGHRGMGKTVLLSAMEDTATDRGWVVLSEIATPGVVDHLVGTTIVRALAKVQGTPIDRIVTGASIASLGGITTSATRRNQEVPSLYSRLSDLFDAIAERNPHSGILLTLDEVEKNSLTDTSTIGAAVQQLRRDNRPIAFAAAGLPHQLDQLLDFPHTTFLRRAIRIDVAPLGWDSARIALLEPIATNGRHIDPADLDRATAATYGYPYLTQLIGDVAWRATPDAEAISAADVDAAIARATELMGSMVHEPALITLTTQQRDYLAAMADTDGPAATSTVAEHLGITIQAASNVRAVLEDQGLIFQPRRGQVDFATPYFREYLVRHGAHPSRAPVAFTGTFGPTSADSTD
ncbi:ATP-binding protein [Williamsia sp. CHRR-6]|uniref:ATP-binding protein n=1 Tax=Williamsia sp. CHRR-6 TaxID=2835871 RepID=UPI001BDADC99|nr:ATP-binding protein [Williamsia sp. CHRR-6]MBT0566776.1 AAA family ATPase [Williamsia sp. CHRR-6]